MELKADKWFGTGGERPVSTTVEKALCVAYQHAVGWGPVGDQVHFTDQVN